MTLKADAKKRIMIPDAHPGDVFAYEDHGNGHYLLVRLTKTAPKQRLTRKAVMQAIDGWQSKPEMSWEKLRSMTREP